MTDNQRKHGLSIPFRKANVSGQTNYTYHTVSGDITLTPTTDGKLCITSTCDDTDVHSYTVDADGVTLELLQDLRRADNREVENNLRHARIPMSQRMRQDIETWRDDPEHPERRTEQLFPEGFQRWNLALDTFSGEEDGTAAMDRDPAFLRAWEMTQPEEDEERDCLRAYVTTLPMRQQQIYQLHILEERTLQEAADIIGVTHQRASAILKQLVKNLKSEFQK